MELTELIQKYKNHFIFKDEKMSLLEAKELVSKLELEPPDLDNEEMKWKVQSFISRTEYHNSLKEEQKNNQKQATEEIDYYNNKLKELGAVVVQPGIRHNGQIDYLNVTYHLDGKVIYKWAAGIKVTVMAEQLKKVYEELTNESSSNL